MKKDSLYWAGFLMALQKLSARFVFSIVLVSFVLSSCVLVPNSNKDEEVSVNAQIKSPSPSETETNVPSATLTPSETPVPTKTLTLTPSVTPSVTTTPSITPLPYKKWSYEEFDEFRSSFTFLLRGGYQFFDELEVLNDYHAYPYSDGSYTSEEKEEIYKKAYEYSDNGEFWCLWATKGWLLQFGVVPYTVGLRNRLVASALLDEVGHKEKEPYCSQFDHETYDIMDHEKTFLDQDLVPTPTPVPRSSLGWTEEEREFVLNNYFLPMSNYFCERYGFDVPGTIDYVYTDDCVWVEEELEKVPNSVIAWAIANHSLFATEVWSHRSYSSHEQYYNDAVKVRKMLIRELKEYFDFESLISPQHHPYLIEKVEEKKQ